MTVVWIALAVVAYVALAALTTYILAKYDDPVDSLTAGLIWPVIWCGAVMFLILGVPLLWAQEKAWGRR